MYFPYLRGRQYELIALRELLDKDVLSSKIIPIIEPVKVSSTLIKTIKLYGEKDRQIALIVNPQVGGFGTDLNQEKNVAIKEEFEKILGNNKSVIYSRILLPYNEKENKTFLQTYTDNIMTICLENDGVPVYEKYYASVNCKYNVIPDDGGFRRKIHNNRVMIYDRFHKLDRNTDYADVEESFSEDHLYYRDDGYVGFSDYSVVGKDYSETGFAPYAVAIHIVYFDKEEKLRIIHFVSDSNDDISDPAGKFEEALEKLVEWNKTMKLSTQGMLAFEDLYKRQSYPGLGTVKKLSIMHHLELMGCYLDKE